ncbi:MAG: hypothetical protein ACXWTP_10340 [Methylosarcina sp.]
MLGSAKNNVLTFCLPPKTFMKIAEADHAPEKQAVFVIRADSFLIADAPFAVNRQ